MASKNWFEVFPINEYITCIREKLSAIEPRFLTNYTNLYFIIGSNAALLIDTGCGVYPLKPLFKEYIQHKELIVVNTHSDFDHIGGNNEFNKVYIHKTEAANLKQTLHFEFLNHTLTVKPTPNIIPINEIDVIELGNLKVGWIHTPGHSPGSICLYTDKGDLFTGDFLHYGTVFLPSKEIFPTVFESISNLERLITTKNLITCHPSHEDYTTNLTLLTEYKVAVENIENLWDQKKPDEYNKAWVIDHGKFKLLIGVGKKERKEFKYLLNKRV